MRDFHGLPVARSHAVESNGLQPRRGSGQTSFAFDNTLDALRRLLCGPLFLFLTVAFFLASTPSSALWPRFQLQLISYDNSNNIVNQFISLLPKDDYKIYYWLWRGATTSIVISELKHQESVQMYRIEGANSCLGKLCPTIVISSNGSAVAFLAGVVVMYDVTPMTESELHRHGGGSHASLSDVGGTAVSFTFIESLESAKCRTIIALNLWRGSLSEPEEYYCRDIPPESIGRWTFRNGHFAPARRAAE